MRARSADGTQIHLEVRGPVGAPTIVLVPGWTEELSWFSFLSRRLRASGFRVVAFDLRGQGRSERPGQADYAIARYGEDLEAVLEAACADSRDVIVVGHSLGAMSIASWAAGDHDVAGRVRATALVNTGFDGLIAATRLLPAALPRPVATWMATRGFLANPLPFPRRLPVRVIERAVRYIAFGPDAGAAQVALFTRMLLTCPPDVRAGAGRSMASMDLLPALPRLTVPTLVVAGENDRLTPASHAERIAQALPALDRLVVLPRTGHMIPLERSAELASILTDLWQRIAGAGVTPQPLPIPA